MGPRFGLSTVGQNAVQFSVEVQHAKCVSSDRRRVRSDWGTGDRSLRVALWAERDIVGQADTKRRTSPVVSTGRRLGAHVVGALRGTFGRDAGKGRLGVHSARQRAHALRASRQGPTSDSAYR